MLYLSSWFQPHTGWSALPLMLWLPLYSFFHPKSSHSHASRTASYHPKYCYLPPQIHIMGQLPIEGWWHMLTHLASTDPSLHPASIQWHQCFPTESFSLPKTKGHLPPKSFLDSSQYQCVLSLPSCLRETSPDCMFSYKTMGENESLWGEDIYLWVSA